LQSNSGIPADYSEIYKMSIYFTMKPIFTTYPTVNDNPKNVLKVHSTEDQDMRSKLTGNLKKTKCIIS